MIAILLLFPFTALTVLVGRQEGHPAVKSWMSVCWQWRFDCSFAYLVTITSIILSSNKIQNGDSGTVLPRLSWKWPLDEWESLQWDIRIRKHCSKAEPKTFVPLKTPFPGARDGQNLTSWRRSLPSPTDPVWWGSMHAISSYRGYRPTNTQTHAARPLQTDRTDNNTLHR